MCLQQFKVKTSGVSEEIFNGKKSESVLAHVMHWTDVRFNESTKIQPWLILVDKILEFFKLTN